MLRLRSSTTTHLRHSPLTIIVVPSHLLRPYPGATLNPRIARLRLRLSPPVPRLSTAAAPHPILARRLLPHQRHQAAVGGNARDHQLWPQLNFNPQQRHSRSQTVSLFPFLDDLGLPLKFELFLASSVPVYSIGDLLKLSTSPLVGISEESQAVVDDLVAHHVWRRGPQSGTPKAARRRKNGGSSKQRSSSPSSSSSTADDSERID